MTATTSPKFYDHAKNHANIGQAVAVAKARRTAIDEGQSYTVTFEGGGHDWYWDGCWYDAIGLAKSLEHNGRQVELRRDRDGERIKIASARY